MATFIALVNLTQQGIRDFESTPERASKFKAIAQKSGVKVKDVFWTMGTYDIVLILEAANDEAIAAVMLGLGSLGNVRSQTLRAFNSAEIKKVIAKVPKSF